MCERAKFVIAYLSGQAVVKTGVTTNSLSPWTGPLKC